MALRVVGAGLGRTGTTSLKQALELLLHERCYHMVDIFQRPQDASLWHAAVRGEPVEWDTLLHDFGASMDWPACAFWRELAAANHDAIVLLSTRESAQKWWASMERTIVPVSKREVPADGSPVALHLAMMHELFERRFAPLEDPAGAIAAYERHNEDVRREIAPERLIDWQPGDDWDPICRGLGLPVPEQPFPHENTSADYRAGQGLANA